MRSVVLFATSLLAGCAPEPPTVDAPAVDEEVVDWVPEPPDRSAYAGCTAWLELDDGDDGFVDLTEETRYDALGWPVFVERRAIEHGSVQRESWTGRDIWGLFTRHELDDDGDGVPETIEEGGPDGHLWAWFAVDLHADGFVDERSTYENVGGMRVGATVDENDDDLVDVAIAYTWDDLRRPLREEHDRGPDGTVDAWWDTVWDGDDSETVHEDEDGDDEVWRTERDELGRLVRHAWDDLDGDDAVEEVHSYADESELVARTDVTTWDEGLVDWIGVREWTWDEAGRPTVEVETFAFVGVDDPLVVRRTWTWTCAR